MARSRNEFGRGNLKCLAPADAGIRIVFSGGDSSRPGRQGVGVHTIAFADLSWIFTNIMAVATEKSIFFHALEIESPAERAAYVEGACDGDEQLLTAVCALLRENDREENPVDRPVGAAWMPTDLVSDDAGVATTRFFPGAMVGPYKLMEQIGE